MREEKVIFNNQCSMLQVQVRKSLQQKDPSLNIEHFIHIYTCLFLSWTSYSAYLYPTPRTE